MKEKILRKYLGIFIHEIRLSGALNYNQSDLMEGKSVYRIIEPSLLYKRLHGLTSKYVAQTAIFPVALIKFIPSA